MEMGCDNEVLKIINKRASCRGFRGKGIPADLLETIIDAGIRAPTRGEFQAYSIIQIEDKETRKELAKLSRDQKWVAQAPVSLLFCIDWRRIKRITEIDMCPFDATDNMADFWLALIEIGICAQNVCLAAESVGLGSVYIGNVVGFLPRLRDMFNIPKYVCPAILLCVGYPKRNIKPRKRFGREIILHKEKYKDIPSDHLMESFKERYNDWKGRLNDERLEKLWKNSSRIHGKKFADDFLEYIKAKGHLNILQYEFGIFYDEVQGTLKNAQWFEFLMEMGFNLNANKSKP